ncbi:MAG: hypothetical protein AABZ29_08390, partial [Gemmatimonadota bacterium]
MPARRPQTLGVGRTKQIFRQRSIARRVLVGPPHRIDVLRGRRAQPVRRMSRQEKRSLIARGRPPMERRGSGEQGHVCARQSLEQVLVAN